MKIMLSNKGITARSSILLLVTIAVAYSYFFFNRPIGTVHILKFGIDNYIPLVPVFAVPYLALLPFFWIIVILFYYRGKYFTPLAIIIIITNLISYLVFSIYQTHISRPVVTGTDIFSEMVRFIYSVDQPYNLVPSGHSSMAAILAVSMFEVKSRYRFVILIFCIVVVLSTLLVRQHFVIDAITGVSLGSIVSVVTYRWWNIRITDQGLANPK